jgi:hypothetical protein
MIGYECVSRSPEHIRFTREIINAFTLNDVAGQIYAHEQVTIFRGHVSLYLYTHKCSRT